MIASWTKPSVWGGFVKENLLVNRPIRMQTSIREIVSFQVTVAILQFLLIGLPISVAGGNLLWRNLRVKAELEQILSQQNSEISRLRQESADSIQICQKMCEAKPRPISSKTGIGGN